MITSYHKTGWLSICFYLFFFMSAQENTVSDRNTPQANPDAVNVLGIAPLVRPSTISARFPTVITRWIMKQIFLFIIIPLLLVCVVHFDCGNCGVCKRPPKHICCISKWSNRSIRSFCYLKRSCTLGTRYNLSYNANR